MGPALALNTTSRSRPVAFMMARPPARSTPAGTSLACLIYGQERMFRELLASLLAIRAGIHVVAHAGRFADARRACEEHGPDVLVLAVSPLDDGALELAREFTASCEHGCVIALVDPGHQFDPPDWLTDRLLATIDRSESLQRMWSALDGLTPAAGDGHERGLRGRLGGRSLSQRESEIFALIGDGLTNAEIANRLALSDHTVRTHRKRIAAKLGTEGSELTRWAIVSRQASQGTPSDA